LKTRARPFLPSLAEWIVDIIVVVVVIIIIIIIVSSSQRKEYKKLCCGRGHDRMIVPLCS